MKKLFIPFVAFITLFASCSKEEIPEEKLQPNPQPAVTAADIEVESFIHRAMDFWYLYEAEIPELQDGHFTSTTKKNEYLASHDSPEALYQDLQASHDRFSFMTDDYVALTKLLQENVSKSNGMDYGLYLFSDTGDEVYGWVRYVLPNSSAAEQGIKRGDFFTEIDGQTLTVHNYSDLMRSGTYQLKVSEVVGGKMIPTDKVVDLVGVEAAENPLLVSDVIEKDGRRIGYLMYNSFSPAFDEELNNAFAEFKGQNITDLVLDLRYNSGGNGETAKDLASMITGQFPGDILVRYQYNDFVQSEIARYYPENLVMKFDSKIRTGEAINSLNLSEVYILTTKSSASASELVINGLRPYINVVQIGENTSGKFQGSTTLHDSPDFDVEDANPNHRYAVQPLILKYANRNGESDFVDGLVPDIKLKESLTNLGTLGDPSEPLFKAAINSILGYSQASDYGTSAFMKGAERGHMKLIGGSDMLKPNYQRLYIDNLPKGLFMVKE